MRALTSNLLLITLTLGFANLSAEKYPPEGWVTNIFQAVSQAEKENKRILINFTGSDWCIYCVRLEENIFSKKEFKEYAEKELVRVFIDFPRRKQLDEYQLNHNEALKMGFGVDGYPRIVVLEPDLQLGLITGYRDISPKEYVEHLKNDNVSDGLSAEDNQQFAEEMKSFLSQVEEVLATIAVAEKEPEVAPEG